MDRNQLNKAIAYALNACKRAEYKARAKQAVYWLNHARDCLDKGYEQPARGAAFLAKLALNGRI